MTFQPDLVGPALLAQAHHTLTTAGLRVAHLVICYDGQEDPQSYTIGGHFHPVGHEAGFQYLLAYALRTVVPGAEDPNVKIIGVRYFEDKTVIVTPFAPEQDEEEDEEE